MPPRALARMVVVRAWACVALSVASAAASDADGMIVIGSTEVTIVVVVLVVETVWRKMVEKVVVVVVEMVIREVMETVVVVCTAWEQGREVLIAGVMNPPPNSPPAPVVVDGNDIHNGRAMVVCVYHAFLTENSRGFSSLMGKRSRDRDCVQHQKNVM